MINIADKHNCCGCSACVQACPKQCISFDEDEQGFRYPLVNKEQCIGCGLCEKVCPCLNQNEPKRPLKVYVAINSNEDIRVKSSSGGIFTMLAEGVIDEGGVVFGARFDDNWEVMHDYTKNKEGLELFRGSKYVQSRIGETYKQTREFLEGGVKVMFTGTPCQIAGLKKYLRKEYDNLLAVEVACHGTPSPMIWRRYLSEICARQKYTIANIASINFRDKKTGWKSYSFTISFKDGYKFSQLHDDNLYMRTFLANYTLRESCLNCKFKYPDGACADITLGDFWGISQLAPRLDNDCGTTLIISRTPRGQFAIDAAQMNCEELPFSLETIAKYNPALVSSSRMPDNKGQFEMALKNSKQSIGVMRAFAGRSVYEQLYLKLARLKHRILSK